MENTVCYDCKINSSAPSEMVSSRSWWYNLWTSNWSPLEANSIKAVEEELQREMNVPDYAKFNSVLSNWIVHTTYYIFLYLVAYLIIRRWKRNDEESSESSAFLPVTLFTISFTVALAAMLLLPITTISYEIMRSFPDNYYIMWLNQDLIDSLWNIIFLASNTTMFILIPFAYFYHEAEGFGNKKSFLGKMYEALTVLTLVAVIIGASIYLTHSIISEKASNTDYLPYSYSLISTLGSIVVLISVPLGFTTLTKVGVNMSVKFYKAEYLSHRKENLDFEIQVLERKLKESKKLSEADRSTYNKEIQKLQEERSFILNYSKLNFIFWNSSSLILTAMNILFPAYFVLRVLVKAFFDRYLHIGGSWITSAIEAIGIVYLVASSLIGFYCLPKLSSLKPRYKDTPIYKIAANVTIMLLLSSSFPVVAELLGLGHLMGYYKHSQYIKTNIFHWLYKTIFLVTMSWQYYKLVKPLPYQMYKSVSSFFKGNEHIE